MLNPKNNVVKILDFIYGGHFGFQNGCYFRPKTSHNLIHRAPFFMSLVSKCMLLSSINPIMLFPIFSDGGHAGFQNGRHLYHDIRLSYDQNYVLFCINIVIIKSASNINAGINQCIYVILVLGVTG